MSARAPRPLRVGLLCYGLDRPVSGTTRVAHQLGAALGAEPDVDIVYLTPYRRGAFRDRPSFYLPGCRLLPGLMLAGGPMITLAAHALRLEVVHDPVGASPFTLGRWAGRYTRVLTVHDSIAYRYPEGYPALNSFLHRRFVPATLPHVDGVITDSAYSRADVKRFLRWPQDRTWVVPLGVAARFQPVSASEATAIAARFGLSEPFVLTVGAQQARKNVARVVAALAELRRRHPSVTLAVAGGSQWAYRGLRDAVASLGMEDRVRWLGHVPDTDLPALYSAATVFAFPSLYEGFGLPVLEAFACGTPVVCARATALPELAADAALLAAPDDQTEWVGVLDRVLADARLRGELRERGQLRAAEFTWERTARETVAVYRRLLTR
jgi:glycosyltransferase involved in cell wall biosynthesis